MSQSNNSLPWPGGCRGAVSLSFDDGSQAQLDLAIPILGEYNLLGTFYIRPGGDDWEKRYAPWQAAAAAGHEIGNHTLSHICSRNFAWGTNPTGLENLTLDYIEADIMEAERRLRKLIPSQPVRTFAYPCYQNYVGEGASRQSYVPVIAKHFPAARGMGEAANHPLYTDLHYLTSSTVAGWMSGADLCGFADDAFKKERWCVLTFHGIQEGPRSSWTPGSSYHGTPLSTESFREMCEYLVEQKDQIWTAPVVKVAQNIIDWRRNIQSSSA